MSCDDAIKEYNKTYFNEYVKQLGTDISNNVPDPYTKFINTIKNDGKIIEFCRQAIYVCENDLYNKPHTDWTWIVILAILVLFVVPVITFCVINRNEIFGNKIKEKKD